MSDGCVGREMWRAKPIQAVATVLRKPQLSVRGGAFSEIAPWPVSLCNPIPARLQRRRRGHQRRHQTGARPEDSKDVITRSKDEELHTQSPVKHRLRTALDATMRPMQGINEQGRAHLATRGPHTCPPLPQAIEKSPTP
jgi:hypothetical protein